MRVHFLSRVKYGGFTIRFALPDNPLLHTDFTAICWTERELLLIEDLHCRNMNFWPFRSCDLDLDTMTFIQNSMRSPWKYTACTYMNYLQRGFRNLSSERHTYRHMSIHNENYIPCRFMGGQQQHNRRIQGNSGDRSHIVTYHLVIFKRSEADLFQLPTTGNCLWLLIVLVLVAWPSMSRSDVEQVFLQSQKTHSSKVSGGFNTLMMSWTQKQ